jgi:hypothetical protein
MPEPERGVPKPERGVPGNGDSRSLAGFPALATLIERMESLLTSLRERGDHRRFFHATYLRTTRTVGSELAAGGFADAAWVERWDVEFARLYLDALEASLPGASLRGATVSVPGPWAVAFGAGGADAGGAVPPLRHVLLGMNAHINYDLPQALLAVISDAEFGDAALLARREADHRHIDSVLSALVDDPEVGDPDASDPEASDQGVGHGRPGARDRLLARANRVATKRFLAESRAKVWGNAQVLARARRDGQATYQERLAELERLAAARVSDLTRPGPVLLRLAVRGFGVVLPPARLASPRMSQPT